MTQDFVGTNNINLFLRKGTFGTRELRGKDCADKKYISTVLAPITRCIFPEEDDILLEYLHEAWKQIEPTRYVPVIPMILVNGAEGIATGWSTSVPNYNPREIISNIRQLLSGEPMQPWYKGFRGTIEKTTSEAGPSYTVHGTIEEIDDTHVRITELPVGGRTRAYKDFLDSSMTKNDKIKKPFITEYINQSDDCTVHFDVKMSKNNMGIAKKVGLLKKFKLTSKISTSNMHLFDANGILTKYDSPEQILGDFYKVRLDLYKKRLKNLLDDLSMDLLKLDNKIKFIQGALKGDIPMFLDPAYLLPVIKERGFTPFPAKTTVEELVAGATDAVETEKSGGAEAAKNGDYGYLLDLGTGKIYPGNVQKLLEEKSQLDRKLEELRRKETPESLWQKDLDALERELDAQDKSDADKQKDRMNLGGPVPPKKLPKNPQKSTKNAKNTETVAKPMDTASASAMETVMEVEVPQKQATEKPPSQKNVAGKKISFDKGFEDTLAVTKKRGPDASRSAQKIRQKLMKPAEGAGISPQKEEGRMRESPSNKKSTPVLDTVSPVSILDRSDGAGFSGARPRRGPANLKPAESAGISPQKEEGKALVELDHPGGAYPGADQRASEEVKMKEHEYLASRLR